MLTWDQYEALRKYQSFSVPAGRSLDEMGAYFLARKFIVSARFNTEERGVSYERIVWALTPEGKLALEEFERYVCEESAKRERDKSEMKKKRLSDALEAFAIATVSAVIAGLVLYYWPGIVSFFRNLLH